MPHFICKCFLSGSQSQRASSLKSLCHQRSSISASDLCGSF
jgi:hypothetical protein